MVYGLQCCRVCSDCGSRTPGAGTSSRWHSHYTVCDSCYQQRNKGFSCPICSRAYRAAAYREMVKCSMCNKFVHSECDPDASPPTYHAKKEANPDYEYACLQCKLKNGRMNAQRRINNNNNTNNNNNNNNNNNAINDDDSMSASQESLYGDDHSNTAGSLQSISATSTDAADKYASDFGLGKGKPLSANKMIAKKRLPGVVGRPKGGGKFSFQKKQRTAEFGRKRGPKAKMRGLFGVPGLGLQRPTCDSSSKTDEEPGVENRLVLCSAKDKFVLTQDICVMCGAIGTDQEGCLISCLQCGQCYHPYCVTVKVTKVILQRGWRCLDCTVCEGCGMKHDESRLILCDDCDISYHIYCMDPPLDIVPTGTWKCKWCAVCQKCGSNTPGTNCAWQNSFTECGPCASLTQCAFCSDAYNDGELLIQCTYCERWLHANCDEIRNEDDAERCIDEGYKCLLCRPKDVLPPHLIALKKPTPITDKNTKAIANVSSIVVGATTSSSLAKLNDDDTASVGTIVDSATAAALHDGCHILDGVQLSDLGLQQIKSMQMELVRKKRKTKSIVVEQPAVKKQEAGIMAAIESVVAGGSLDNSIEDIKVEPLDPHEEAEIYKDGMLWDKDSGPPDGFTIGTNEHGAAVLRKKRQRNLQKLGIGGFMVRNRAVRKDGGNAAGNAKDSIDGEDGPPVDGALHFTTTTAEEKKKQIRKKVKTKLADTYPSYLQEAFFGKNLLNVSKLKFESSSSDDEAKPGVTEDKTIQLSTEEVNILNAQRLKQQKLLEEKNKQQASSVTATVQLQAGVGASQPPQAAQQHVTLTSATNAILAPNAVVNVNQATKPIVSSMPSNSSIRVKLETAATTSQDIEMTDVSNLPVVTATVPSASDIVVAARKNELNEISLENLNYKIDTTQTDESKLQRVTVPNAQMAQTINKLGGVAVPNLATTNVLMTKQQIPMHANVSTVQTMVVNSIQKKPSIMTSDNQQMNVEMQTITVSQQAVVPPTSLQQHPLHHHQSQAAIDNKSQQHSIPIQMQLNQRVLTNQPQLNQTMQSISQIEPMLQSPIDNNIVQKIG